MDTQLLPFQSLRVMLEATLPRRAMIAISAACDGDAHAQLAYGLACAFVEAGRSTTLIVVGKGESEFNGERSVFERLGGTFHYLPERPAEASALLNELSASYEVLVTLTPPITENATALHICSVAKAVLLAVRLGRKITAADQRSVERLTRVGANLIGTVAMRVADKAPPVADRKSANAPRPVEARATS